MQCLGCQYVERSGSLPLKRPNCWQAVSSCLLVSSHPPPPNLRPQQNSEFSAEVIGETGRPLGTRVKEHRKEVEGITGAFTRAEKTRAASISNESAITDHVSSENQLIDWENVKIMDHEWDRTTRVIREAMWIRNTNNTNQDDGATNWAMSGTCYLLTSETKSQSWWRPQLRGQNVNK